MNTFQIVLYIHLLPLVIRIGAGSALAVGAAKTVREFRGDRPMSKVFDTVTTLRRVGPGQVATRVPRLLWSEGRSFGLSCTLAELPPRRVAKTEVRMVPVPVTPMCRIFHEELTRLDGDERIEVAQRARMCELGIEGLHVGFADDGRAIYAQWLVTPATQRSLHAALPGLYPRLEDHEVLVEGAYTFLEFRRLGVMADGMHQLLERAHHAGASRALTYVSAGYAPSIRGCANVRFRLDHLRLDRRRLLRKQTAFRPLDDAARTTWQETVVNARPRSSPTRAPSSPDSATMSASAQ